MIGIDETVKTFIDAWKLMTGRFLGSDCRHARGVTSTFANVPLANLNFSFQARPALDAADLRRMLQTMQQRAGACPHPSFIVLCQDWMPPDWPAIVADEGFTFSLDTVAMAAETLSPLRRPLPELEYRRVSDLETARELATVNAMAYAVYGMPVAMWDCMGTMRLWHPESYGYVGYVDGKAVSSAAVFPIDGAMYIAWVATVPEMHGRGYGEAVLRQAIEKAQAAMGKQRLVLHASVMGEPLYRSMGFQPGGKLQLLSPAWASPSNKVGGADSADGLRHPSPNPGAWT